ncbi:MAG: hypothetical protein EWV64_12535 [Microcystis flos-aquae Ma_QC_C_20070823_S18]|jgi:hypothetical protein|uniref:Uncharacterized protein n=1 Tax=Microcystis flos-aquae Mf_QC_C_20070823_S10D TaxID=2486236 RepID=A0A552KLR6_9CHRO|nr:MAG: hypothetical protein EWV64_12535 [Microcystis flos-aquae Ma_QC_C_20070823_S18]TRT92613.1 MAG: hypothetical protein EWV65_20380 [Microcystis flos-aquae Ma_QC_C_20070823_S18D]TRV08918.1 MAG: hypothetical protein EWV45_16835 [Microcystis flos-aquae Mf_QC_C_20070823_S10D]TRV28402.1 MAG: hypothetical protein EWV72_02620 [Microcystis flos-aquae Mf_QC_C_20070823_S10]TRV30281.1 MAG: hypothetical protein EWV70_19665 [Microcystis flos-aquae Mf_QC_C_20070823_S20]TRV38688.1 MAG: hypothetical prote
MGMVRSLKSISGAVRATLGNAPYGDSVLLRSAFGIALMLLESQYLIAFLPKTAKTAIQHNEGSRSPKK